MKLLAAGKSVSEIGALFHLGATTISTYRARILKKMHMKTNADLIQYAIAQQLI
jgi:two-component system, NarL family, invasion response regulator UvrY